MCLIVFHGCCVITSQTKRHYTRFACQSFKVPELLLLSRAIFPEKSLRDFCFVCCSKKNSLPWPANFRFKSGWVWSLLILLDACKLWWSALMGLEYSWDYGKVWIDPRRKRRRPVRWWYSTTTWCEQRNPQVNSENFPRSIGCIVMPMSVLLKLPWKRGRRWRRKKKTLPCCKLSEMFTESPSSFIMVQKTIIWHDSRAWQSQVVKRFGIGSEKGGQSYRWMMMVNLHEVLYARP